MKKIIIELTTIFLLTSCLFYSAMGKVLRACYMTKEEMSNLTDTFDDKCIPIVTDLAFDESIKNKLIAEVHLKNDDFQKININDYSMKYLYLEGLCIPKFFYSFSMSNQINREIKDWLLFNRKNLLECHK